MDLTAACAQVEQASRGLAHPEHRAAAEATLLEFRRSPHALAACRHILDTSAAIEAQFQAAATLRDAALRDWNALPPTERANLRQHCLHLILQKQPPPPPVVASQIISTLAVLLKRAWLDDDADRGAMLAEAEHAVSAASTSSARRVGLLLFAAVVAEFSPSTSSPMQLPWDFHERCRANLERDFLKHFFLHGAGVARAAFENGAALSGADDGVCVGALRLMSAALAWDFARGGGVGAAGGFGYVPPPSDGGGSRTLAETSNAEGSAKVTPGPEWRDALLAPGAVDWVFALHASAHARVSAGGDLSSAALNLRAAARAVVAALCQLAGDLFPNLAEDPAGDARRAHFARCVASLNGTTTPAQTTAANAARGLGEDVLVDVAVSLSALASNHPTAYFLAPTPPPPGLAGGGDAGGGGGGGGEAAAAGGASGLSVLGELTLAVLHAGALTSDAEGTASEDALRLLMDAWGSLLSGRMTDPRLGGDPNAGVPSEVIQGAAQVFQAYVQAGLAGAAAAAFEEDDGQEEEGKAGAAALDERLSLAAVVGRAAPEASLPFLAAAADAKKTELSDAIARGADPTVASEQLWWLARLIPHVLADPFDGEIPLPPDALAERSRTATLAGQPCPVDALSTAYVNLACLCLDDTARSAISPRLMETFLWGAARWADTYLMPEDVGGSLHAAVFAGGGGGGGRVHGGVGAGAGLGAHVTNQPPGPFSEHGGGVQVLDALLRVARVALTAWPGETGVQGVAAQKLLPALTRRRALCRACVASASWGAIADAEAMALAQATDPGGAAAAAAAAARGGVAVAVASGGVAFPPEIHRGVMEALGRAAEGLNDEGQCREYIARVLTPLGGVLHAVASDPGAMTHPGGESRAVAALEAARGAARATVARSQAPVFAFFASNFDVLIATQRGGGGSAQISKLVLRLTEELVANQACFLGPTHATALCRHVLRVVETYAGGGRGRVGAGEGGRAERVKEAYKEVKALLRMLTHVVNSDNGLDHDEVGEGRVANGMTPGGGDAQKVDVAQVVFLGLNVVIPLITDELLTFPKLCHQYFSLLAHMLEAYPGKVAALPPDLFNTLMGTLDFGLKHADAETSRESLSALAAMASFHHSSTIAGQPGLGAHNAPTPERGNVGVLAHLMRVVLNRLIFEDASMDLAESAADALLPLMHCERVAFEDVARELLGRLSGNQGAMEHVSRALTELTTGGGLTDRVDRANKRRFRRNVAKFLTETRGFVRHN